MLDENVELEKDGQKISLIGVQNWGRGFIQMGDLDKALNENNVALECDRNFYGAWISRAEAL